MNQIKRKKTKGKLKYWSFPKGKPAPINYLWDGKGWRRK